MKPKSGKGGRRVRIEGEDYVVGEENILDEWDF